MEDKRITEPLNKCRLAVEMLSYIMLLIYRVFAPSVVQSIHTISYGMFLSTFYTYLQLF